MFTARKEAWCRHFLQQISTAGPVTVTDPGVNRYFVSMDEAVELVLLAARLAGGGGIFIPDLGEPVRILDLARQLIMEAGLQPGDDIPIVMTGLRPGDKMAEQIVSDLESWIRGPCQAPLDQNSAAVTPGIRLRNGSDEGKRRAARRPGPARTVVPARARISPQ